MTTEIEEPPVSEAKAEQPMPEMPVPAKEHAWLERFVGEWETSAEICCNPAEPPMLCAGTETAAMLGGFWLVARGSSEMGKMPFESVLTLGYDPKRGKYVGTWIDSMTSHLWQYEGTVNAAGNILTLDTEAEFPGAPGKLSRFKEVTEFKSDDHRIFTSSIEGENGEWRTTVTVNYRRKK
ncbi:MAG TPA: DUF1579 domain-containing protein [Chthoniobacteraceae bacterium]|jgi:hypothetical protein